MTGPNGKDAGFTLLEILVVLLIIGIMMGMALLSVTPRDREKEAREELTRFKTLLDLAAREAALDGREWGVRFASHGYAFLMLDDKNHWIPPPGGERQLHPRHISDTLSVALRLEDASHPEDLNIPPKSDVPPQVLISSDGEMTSFELDLGVPAARDEGVKYRLQVSMTGRGRVEKVVEKKQ
ncbi:MAG: type II secretion system minor pseudopilin GspH [Magnetococcales bacterium]|nr:type II secretion system minor pseudopilin GspH [Magnetococcales bacterium]